MDEAARPPGSRERRVRLPQFPGGERRSSTRYPLSLELRYTVQIRHRPVEAGYGRIVDLSSSGLRFTAERPLETGLRVELAILWPLVLEGGVQLQLAVSGTVIRTDGYDAALQFHHHEFRTRGAAATIGGGKPTIQPLTLTPRSAF